ncbi:MAG: hypothetical protein WB615_03465 [Candidatus Tumulicola sp.]
MRRLDLAKFLLKLATNARELDKYENMNKKQRTARMVKAGLKRAQQAAVLSGDMRRVMEALKAELEGVVETIDEGIMEQAPFCEINA